MAGSNSGGWEYLSSYVKQMGSHTLVKEDDRKKQMKARMKKKESK